MNRKEDRQKRYEQEKIKKYVSLGKNKLEIRIRKLEDDARLARLAMLKIIIDEEEEKERQTERTGGLISPRKYPESGK